jgi:hypothetical protein
MRTCCLGFILLLMNVITAQATENDAEMTIADSHVRLLQSEIVKQEYQLQRLKLDTQSNKVLNHNQINKQKVMGMFCLFDFKFRNLGFWGIWRVESS